MRQSSPSAAFCVELIASRKSFGPVAALRNGMLALRAGEVHALLGENGAGKSTLVKILAGVHAPDGGEFRVNGQAVRFQRPSDARNAGIAVIYQEPTLFGDLSITENIYMGRQPVDRWGRLQHKQMNDAVIALLRRLGVALDASRLVRGLSIADQQIVEIAKALSQNESIAPSTNYIITEILHRLQNFMKCNNDFLPLIIG